MNKSAEMTRVHGWRMKSISMMCKRRKKEKRKRHLIGKGELVGIIRGPTKEASKPRERQ
jgi:hypothetical protein